MPDSSCTARYPRLPKRSKITGKSAKNPSRLQSTNTCTNLHRWQRLNGPVLHLQTAHPPELLLIVRDQSQVRRDSMGGNPQISVADQLALQFEFGANPAIHFTCRFW